MTARKPARSACLASSDRLTQEPFSRPLENTLNTETRSSVRVRVFWGGGWFGDVDSVSEVQGAGNDREGETCLPGHSTSETDSQGDAKELRCSAWSPRGP